MAGQITGIMTVCGNWSATGAPLRGRQCSS